MMHLISSGYEFNDHWKCFSPWKWLNIDFIAHHQQKPHSLIDAYLTTISMFEIFTKTKILFKP